MSSSRSKERSQLASLLHGAVLRVIKKLYKDYTGLYRDNGKENGNYYLGALGRQNVEII